MGSLYSNRGKEALLFGGCPAIPRFGQQVVAASYSSAQAALAFIEHIVAIRKSAKGGEIKIFAGKQYC